MHPDDHTKDKKPAKAATTPEERLLRRDDVAAYTARPGLEYAYRPGAVLVDVRDLELVQTALEERGGEQIESDSQHLARFTMPSDVDIPALLEELRSSRVDRVPMVSPLHVMTGSPRWCGWPGADPEPAGKLGPAAGKVGDKKQPGHGVRIAVIDTGLDEAAQSHPLLDGVGVGGPDDIDPTPDGVPADGYIDDQAGHAAFIAGVIRQNAPGAEVIIFKVLDTQGVTDEVAVAAGIRRAVEAECDIINLSLGGYTDRDQPPQAVAHALDEAPRTTAVVAAAGNLNSSRVTWPAAMKRVVAVGAVDANGTKASFSNYGPWVDASANGVDVHGVYVHGEENPEIETDRHPDHFDGHALWSGSSFSCARISAATAVEMSSNGGSGREAVLRLVEDPHATVVSGLGVLLA